MPASKVRKPKTWAEELADLEDPAPRDFDPEEHDPAVTFSAESDDGSDGDNARAHYEKQEQSALRKSEKIDLGPKYTGVSVGRDDFGLGDASDASEDSGTGDGDELSGDEASYNGLDAPGNAAQANRNGRSQINEEPDSGSDVDAEEEMNDIDFESESEEDDMNTGDDESAGTSPPSSPSSDRAAIRKMMAQEQTVVASSLAKAAQSDVNKGRALKRQRQTFNSLLNMRIKLQKALISTNSLPPPSSDQEIPPDHTAAIEAAETAAIHLWTSLNTLRSSLHPSSSTSKKRPLSATTTTSSSALWSSMQDHEKHSTPLRRATLAKWSEKTAPIPTISRGSKFSQAPTQQPLMSMLDQQLSGSNLDRHIARTRVARSCAPVQAARQAEKGRSRRVDEQEEERTAIYDDADFYTLLLRELVDQRMGEQSNTHTGTGASGTIKIPSQRDLRAKKTVDTKASKGRKMRYNVHEKLLNFMAPEDLGVWGERQRRELFAGLLGQKARVDMMAEEEGDGDEMDVDSAEEEQEGEGGLRLFG